MNPEDLTIADVAAGDPDFGILVTALEAAGLTAAVADPEAELTVFAPTNAAFARLAADLGFRGDPEDPDAVFGAIADALAGLAPDGDPIPLLSEVLLYHVAGTPLTAAEIADAASVPTLAGAAITPDGSRLIDREPDLLDPAITTADIGTANGTIQVIDRVLLPLDVPGNDAPTIAGIAAGNADFEVLTLALDAAGLTGALDDPDADLTAFAPTDAAFADLAGRLGFTGDPEDAEAVFGAIAGALTDLAPDGDPIPLLTDILLYHVSPGAAGRDALIEAPSVATLNGTALIPSETGILDADPGAENAGFIEGLTDIRASNGTVQAIDRVLLPLDLEDPAPQSTIAEIVAASGTGFDGDTGDFDALLAALQTADLVGALDQASDSFTVAAPTDQAFIELARTFGADPADEAEAFDAVVATLTSLAPDGDPVPLLTDILTYHVFEGAFTRVSLAEGPALSSLLGPAPETDGDSLADAEGDVRDPQFIDAASDIVASNGLVQAIDRVLLPLDVPEVVGSGGPDDDTITVGEATEAVMGGAGDDTAVFAQAFSEAAFAPIEGGFAVTLRDRTVDLMAIETLQFADETLAVDGSEAAAAVSRLYGAALGRDGDIAGQTFWSGVAEARGLAAVAEGFTGSDEFAARFGADPDHGAYIDALYREVLGRGAFMMRYEEADDFGAPEVGFNVCAFWRLDALARIGRTGEAREHFTDLLAARNSLGLMAEDTDFRTGEAWGNFPQTYSMVGIINGAVRLSKPWESEI